MKDLETLHELCDTVSDTLAEVNDKIQKSDGKLTAGDVDYVDKLTHTLKSLKTTIAMIEKHNYSGRYWDGGMERKRDSMGRYSRDEAKDAFIEEIEEIMDKAPDERIRKKLEHLISDMR